jgi:hypothetical protein
MKLICLGAMIAIVRVRVRVSAVDRQYSTVTVNIRPPYRETHTSVR